MKSKLKEIQQRFVYTKDGLLDKWKIHKLPGTIKGDCEDHALTLLWELAGQSMLRFWWLQISGQACIWYVTSYNGAGHAVLWYKGWWADNMEKTWYTTAEMRHTRRFPYPAPLVALKQIIGKL